MSHSFDAQIIRFVPYIHKGPPKRNSIKRRGNKETIPVEKKRITLSEELSTSPRVPPHLAAENDKDLKGRDIYETGQCDTVNRNVGFASGSYSLENEGVQFNYPARLLSPEQELRKDDKVPLSFEDVCQDAVMVIGDSSDSPAATVRSHSVTRLNKQSGVPEIVTVDYSGRNETDNPDNVDDTMNRQLPVMTESQDDRRQACSLSSRLPSSSLISSLINPGKPTDGGSNDIYEGAIQYKVQDPAQERANEQGTCSELAINLVDDDNDDNDDNNDNEKSYEIMPDVPSEQERSQLKRRREDANSARHRESTLGGQSPVSHPSECEPHGTAQICVKDSEDKGGDTSDGSSDRQSGSQKRLKSARRLSGQRQQRDDNGAIEDAEYEVDEILQVRIYHGRLQYRAKWSGYGDDPTWYPEGNFEYSPYKLLEFYEANPSCPGPPKRLNIWTKRFQQEEDAGDQLDGCQC
ncbi:hypothetical protein HBI24_210770 [Parastagonospora nodorum]|nr:hypothetical protein HBI24_210770 [Parastagonospora nodorum]